MNGPRRSKTMFDVVSLLMAAKERRESVVTSPKIAAKRHKTRDIRQI